MENALHVHTLAYLILLGWQDSLNWSTDTTNPYENPGCIFQEFIIIIKFQTKKWKEFKLD